MRRFILGLVMLLAAGPAAAVPLYKVDVWLAAESGGIYDDAKPPPLSNSSTVTFWERVSVSGATGYAAGAAGPGSVAAVAQAFYSVVDPTEKTCATGIVEALSTIDDLIVWGTGVVNGLYLHMDLSGSISLLELGTTDWAGSELLIDFRLDEKSTSGYREIREPFGFEAVGVLDGVWPSSQEAFDSSILVGPFDGVATGAGNPHTLRIAIRIVSYTCVWAPSVIGDEMDVTGDLGSTMSFTRSGPVFTSDDENFIAATSVDADIDLDGTWTGTPVSAPEPTSPLLSVAVLLTLAGLRRLH